MATGTARAQDAERYVRAENGAQLRVFQDANARTVTTLGAGDLLRVHDENTFSLPDGRTLVWYEVSAPKGLPVWVFGEYLAKTNARDVLAVTGDAVRMRPSPESSIASYPLRSMLNRGQRVLFVERHDPSAAFGADWIRVWSPPEARAWIDASETQPVTDAVAARQEWQRDLRVLPRAEAKPQPAESEGTEPADPGEASGSEPAQADQDQGAGGGDDIPDEAYRSLAYGETLLQNARKKSTSASEADFAPAIRAFEVVLDMVPENSPVAENARLQLDRAQTLADLAAARDELRHLEERRAERLEKLLSDQKDAAVKDTVHWGRFMGRGWVVRKRTPDGTRYYLRWGGETVFEISCESGRYDLDLFEGFEIGVRGTMLRQAMQATEEEGALVALLDISRIEVISGSPAR